MYTLSKNLVVCGFLFFCSWSFGAASEEALLLQEIHDSFSSVFDLRAPSGLIHSFMPRNLPQWNNTVEKATTFIKKNITLDKTLTRNNQFAKEANTKICTIIEEWNRLIHKDVGDASAKRQSAAILKSIENELELLYRDSYAKTYKLPGNKKAHGILMLLLRTLSELAKAAREDLVKN
jgi:hypothetical protein